MLLRIQVQEPVPSPPAISGGQRSMSTICRGTLKSKPWSCNQWQNSYKHQRIFLILAVFLLDVAAMASNSDEKQILRGTKDYDDSLSLTSPSFDEREFILKLLNDKRTLLAALHNEKKEKLRWKEEFEKKSQELDQVDNCSGNATSSTNQTGSSTGLSALNLNDEAELNRLYKKIREKDDRIREFQSKNDRLLNQVAVLKSEVIRLAGTLTRIDSVQPVVDTDLLREQLELYEEDFKKEKDDKVVAQEKLSVLTEQLRDSHEMIQSLTVELDMYKKAYEREKREKENNLLRTCQTGSDSNRTENTTLETSRRRPETSLPTPHLQVVYPVTNDRVEYDEQRRRRQLHQVGVLTRDIQRSSTYDTNPVDPSLWWSS